MLRDFLFTSESVSEGHPDKVSDQISDAILDAYLAGDKESRVACETLVTANESSGFVCLAGEVSSRVTIEVEDIARNVIRNIGYSDEGIGFSADSVEIKTLLHKQSADIARGVKISREQGAGDQGIVFGYATDQTEELMPAPIALAHRILHSMAKLRHAGQLPGILPDSKSQVTMEFRDRRPVRIATIVVSSHHRDSLTQSDLKEIIVEQVIKQVIPAKLLQKTDYIINPAGQFLIGGPLADAGLTGRKVIVDTYGGWGRHGGGAFSGKDPSKTDRSAAYMARYCAKNIVAAGLAKECEIQVSYAIGCAQPISIHLETFGTGIIEEEKIVERIRDNFDFSPYGVIESLDLLAKERCYLQTAAYGHFGQEGETFTWEKTDRTEELQAGIAPNRAERAEREEHFKEHLQATGI